MNNVVLMGRLTREVEVKYTNGDTPMCIANFTIAIDKRNKKDGTNFINCKAFGKTAENISKFFQKGSMICVNGSIEQSSYTNKEDRKITITEIVVTNFSFCGGSKGENNSNIEDFSTGIRSEDSPF